MRSFKIAGFVVALITLLVGCDNPPPAADIKKIELPEMGAETVSYDFDNKSSGWQFFDGVWEFRQNDGVGVLAQAADSLGRRVFPLALWNENSFSDLDVSVRLKPISGEMDASGGLVFRARDKDNYYVVRANSLEDNFRLYTFIDGDRSQIAGTTVPMPALGEWHTIRVVAVGSHIQIYLDGVLTIDHQDTTFSEGYVGVWTKADAVTEFDDLVVKGMPAALK